MCSICFLKSALTMKSRSLRSIARRIRWRYVLAVAGALLVAAAPVSVTETLTATFPALSPVNLAHFLADFTNHPRLYPYLDTWSIEEQASNYTSWRYTVSYACGARCSGRAVVVAHDEHANSPTHGLTAKKYRLEVEHYYCSQLTLLPWPKLCGELRTEAVIRADQNSSNGAVYTEISSVRCAALRALLGRCGAELRIIRNDHLQRLKQLLQQYQ